jgi:hypothetical protein
VHHEWDAAMTPSTMAITGQRGSNAMDLPLSSMVLMSQHGCDILGNHSPRGGRSHGRAKFRALIVDKLKDEQGKLITLSTEVFWHLYEEFPHSIAFSGNTLSLSQ